MSTTIELSFPFGRYHATPWDRSVNEGAIEWPPSPWRVARAVYATYKQRCPDEVEADVLELIELLAEPPSYSLPPWAEAHTRHYYPDTADGTDKVFDPFVVMSRDATLRITWDCTLDSAQRALLDRLLSVVPYLGRADSICAARVLGDDDADGDEERFECLPEDIGRAGDAVPVLCLERPLNTQVLEQRSSDLRSARLRVPAGARWVTYNRPPAPVPDGENRRPARPRIGAVRFAIADPVRPSRFAAVAMTGVLRQAALSRYGSLYGGAVSEQLTGKRPDGSPLAGHRHAHYLALDTDADGLLDHLAVWIPGGLSREEERSLAHVTSLRGYGHVRDFRPCSLAIEAAGSAELVLPELCGPARTWRSFTPFAPSRHLRGGGLLERMLRLVTLECDWRGLPHPIRVDLSSGHALAFRRHRPTRERLQDAPFAVMLEVEFAAPVDGPLLLGRNAHFGLGMFLPIKDE